MGSGFYYHPYPHPTPNPIPSTEARLQAPWPMTSYPRWRAAGLPHPLSTHPKTQPGLKRKGNGTGGAAQGVRELTMR